MSNDDKRLPQPQFDEFVKALALPSEALGFFVCAICEDGTGHVWTWVHAEAETTDGSDPATMILETVRGGIEGAIEKLKGDGGPDVGSN